MYYQIIYSVANKEQINVFTNEIKEYTEILGDIFKKEEIDTPELVKQVINNLKTVSSYTFESKNTVYFYDFTKLKFELDDEQKEHVKRLYNIMINNISALDLSKMGTGKTFTSSYLVHKMKLKTIIICPVSVVTKWKDMKNKGVPILDVISYDSLRGKNQPYLKIVEDENDKTYYEPSEYLIKLLEGGKIMIILDEVHRTKNNTLTFKAVNTISKILFEVNKNNYILLISGTIIDKKEFQFYNILRIMGIITMNSLSVYDSKNGVLKLRGLNQLWKKCEILDINMTDKIIKKHGGWNKENLNDIAYDLFIEVIEKNLSSKILVNDSFADLDIRNRFISPRTSQENEELSYYVSKFAGLPFFTRTLNSDLEINTKNLSGSFGELQLILVAIEYAKRNIFIREIQNILDEEENTKVVLACSFIKTIDFICDSLYAYEPIKMTGSVPKNQRDELYSKFQEPNDNYRLLVGNIDVLSTGIDLDDKDGNYPRKVLVSPNYKTMILRQFIYRFKRKLTKSNTTIDMIYAKLKGLDESKLIKALETKGNIMKEASLDLDEGEHYPDSNKDDFESYKYTDLKKLDNMVKIKKVFNMED